MNTSPEQSFALCNSADLSMAGRPCRLMSCTLARPAGPLQSATRAATRLPQPLHPCGDEMDYQPDRF